MYKHILVPTDGSKLAMRAVKHAAGLAKACKAKLTVLYVIEPYLPPVGGENMLPSVFAQDEAAYRLVADKAADAALAKVTRALATSRVKCDTLKIVDALPWRGIVEGARKRRCDVVVMASHGRGALAGVVLGSETTKVLAHTKVPVLVCR